MPVGIHLLWKLGAHHLKKFYLRIRLSATLCHINIVANENLKTLNIRLEAALFRNSHIELKDLFILKPEAKLSHRRCLRSILL